MNHNGMLRGFYGHHKCATSWIQGIILKVCACIGLTATNFNTPRQFDYDLKTRLEKIPVDFFSFTNAELRYTQDLPPHKAFHVIRDPRDVLVSGYFSHLHSHLIAGWPELVGHREQLKNLSEEEGLLLEMEFNASTFEHMRTWDYTQPHVLEIKFENLIANPGELLLEAFSFLNLVDVRDMNFSRRGSLLLNRTAQYIRSASRGLFPFQYKLERIPAEYVQTLIYQSRFSRFSEGREQGEEDCTSHYRKGIAGDWKNYFTDRIMQAFQEKYGDLLTKLGYENSSDW